ncbi:transcription antitermination factor NusB [Congregibacter sp.]|uniref:transcription antitermination factor NusB n=1 Tax=Congregibacter sp. TaxID=2744308 RepID=UPI003F6A91FA
MTKQAQQELVARRRKARHYALQALYQWHMAGATSSDIEAEFRTDYDFAVVDLEYFQALIHGVPPLVDELDGLLEPLLDRELRELDPIERSLLRMGGFELRDRIDVPYRVVINESVALAKKFGAAESYKYINGVLDKLARQLRGPEVSAGR